MKTFLLVLTLLFSIGFAFAQNTLKLTLKDNSTNEPIRFASVSISKTNIVTKSDSTGVAILDNVPDGRQTVLLGLIGYRSKEIQYDFPIADTSEQIILMDSEAQDMEEVVITATRSSRAISDIPTRVETIGGEELDEKITMQPANAKMILTESTGIQTQQTSATSANASIRIQGLDGKYTQLLKDGFPLYSGFSGGLSLVQIPPLDLKRVEVIKGATSTLYGGGAIAGLINFITKEPTDERELSFLLNGNITNAADFSGFYSQKFKRTGITVYAAQNIQAAYDADKDGLSDIPKFSRFTLNPKFFYYINPSAILSFGLNSSFEDRLGGDMILIENKASNEHSYFEKNRSSRISSQLKFEKHFVDESVFFFKNSIGIFNRSIRKSDYYFSGKQLSSFSELSYLFNTGKSEWIFGGNLWTDNFQQDNATPYSLNNNLFVGGAFIQNSLKASEKFIIESGLRVDGTNENDFFILPRISVLYKITPKFSSRIGGGLGYKTPTLFSEEAEERSFRDIQPLDLSKVRSEKSIGMNFDLNYKTRLFETVSFSINQMFFYTRLNRPLILDNIPLSNGRYEFTNAEGYLDSKGFETNVRLRYDDISLYCGYTFIDAIRHFNSTKVINPLTARNRIYTTLSYEWDERLIASYELFYTGRQTLSNGETRPDYWVMGASVQYRFKHFSLFVNAENFTDTRQTRHESIYTGSLQNPQFKEIWAPTDGFVFNGGIRVNL